MVMMMMMMGAVICRTASSTAPEHAFDGHQNGSQ